MNNLETIFAFTVGALLGGLGILAATFVWHLLKP